MLDRCFTLCMHLPQKININIIFLFNLLLAVTFKFVPLILLGLINQIYFLKEFLVFSFRNEVQVAASMF
jgi:hypothetical protein